MKRLYFAALFIPAFLAFQGGDPDLRVIIENAQALHTAGNFDSAYAVMNEEFDTAGISLELQFDAVMLKAMCARDMRSRRRLRHVFNEMLELRTNLPDSTYRKADFLLETSCNFSSLGMWADARKWIHRGHEYGTHNSLGNKYFGYLHYISGCIDQFGEGPIGEASMHYTEALHLLIDSGTGVSLQAARCYRGLGIIARNEGDYKKGIDHHERELRILQEMYSDSHFEAAAVHYNLGNIYYEMGAWLSALDHYLATLPVWTMHYRPGASFLRFLNEAIGDMYWELGRYEEAVVHYDLSLAGEEVIDNDASADVTAAGKESVALGDYDRALQYYQSALDWRRENFGEGHPLTGACNNFVARVYKYKGLDEKALWLYHKSLISLASGFDDSSFYTLPAIQQVPHGSEKYVVEALEAKAELLWSWDQGDARRNTEAAYAHLQFAISLIDRVRQNPISEESKLFWSSRAFPVFERAIELANDLRQYNDRRYLSEAFSIAEKSKAFVLLSAMQANSPNHYAGVSQKLLARERVLHEGLRKYSGRVLVEEKRCEDARDKKLDTWKRHLQQLNLQYNAFLDSLRFEQPEYYAMKYNVEVVTLDKVQRSLHSGTAMLLFFEGTRTLSTFTLTRGQVILHVINLDSSYQEQIRILRAHLEVPGGDDWKELSQAFFKQYIAPVIPGETAISKLIVIPDGALSYLPFESLVYSSDQSDPSTFSLLLDRYAISYAQSATVLAQAGGVHSIPARCAYVGFAPEYGGEMNGMRELGPLKYNRAEVQRASLHFPKSQVFNSSAATKANFRQHASNATIIHLAMHAQIDEDVPLLSHLLFDLDTIETEEGRLFAYELQSFRINAQLAVLSACNTGVGQWRRGEGVMSMARSFQYAGCPSIATTMWSVDDLASADLMDSFARYLAEGLPKHEALRQAKLDYLADADPATAHPFYWAGFTLIGRTDPIRTRDRMVWWPFILAAGLVLVVGVSRFLRRV